MPHILPPAGTRFQDRRNALTLPASRNFQRSRWPS